MEGFLFIIIYLFRESMRAWVEREGKQERERERIFIRLHAQHGSQCGAQSWPSSWPESKLRARHVTDGVTQVPQGFCEMIFKAKYKRWSSPIPHVFFNFCKIWPVWLKETSESTFGTEEWKGRTWVPAATLRDAFLEEVSFEKVPSFYKGFSWPPAHPVTRPVPIPPKDWYLSKPLLGNT